MASIMAPRQKLRSDDIGLTLVPVANLPIWQPFIDWIRRS
jgi:hypothetical protein